MKQLLLSFALFLMFPAALLAQEETENQSIDQSIEETFGPTLKAVGDVVFTSIKLGEADPLNISVAEGASFQESLTETDDGLVVDGLTLTRLTKAQAKDFSLTKGFLIADIDTSAVAYDYAFKQGQAISHINGQPVGNFSEVKAAMVVGGDTTVFTQKPGNLKMPFVIIWLLVGAILFTVYFRFINITGFRHAINVVRGKYDNPLDSGEVSHFQALTAALSGTVGLGNIAGVAIAISMGGPGATVWMILAGFLGMTSKFAECTLGLKYRTKHADGSVSGGPMYYLSRGLAEKGWGRAGKVLAAIFAIFCIGGSFGGGNMAQINQATAQFIDMTGGEGSYFYDHAWLFGVIMAVLVAVVIIGGIKSIAKVTDKVVPFMVGIYLLAAFIILGAHVTDIPAAIGSIFSGAFDSKAIYGGFVGVLIVGLQRAAFSNEAGVGSASIAHSAARTEEPVSEGIVALLEPFIDTIVVCTMTALVIIITGTADPSVTEGVNLTSRAFESVISWFPYVLTAAVILFAFSTMISWSYYGLKSWTYLFGKNNAADISYKVLFCVFVVLGSTLSLGQVFYFSDAMIFAMAFPNVLGLYFLAPVVRKELNNYRAKIKSGEIKKVK